MTGREFEEEIKKAGYSQIKFANAMGVHRTTIAAKCSSPVVEAHWVYALAGLVASEASATAARAGEISEAAGLIASKAHPDAVKKQKQQRRKTS